MKKLLCHLSSVISICLFVAAIFVIHHKLRDYHYHDIVVQFRTVRWTAPLLAVGLTALNYVVLTAYDALALHYVRHRLAYWKLGLASFIGFVFSNNATIVGGSAARYRIYSSLGVSATEVAKLVVFCGFTFWLGFFALGGITFVTLPSHIPETLHIPLASAWPLGILFLIVVGLYLALVIFRKTPLRIRSWEFPLPSLGLSAGQIAISALDWLVAAAVLYVLLPPGTTLTFPRSLSAFMLAQAAGLLSYIPGGLGVFETVILVLLGASAEAPAVVGSLLLYRLIYYILPLLIASFLLAANELVAERVRLRQFSLMFARWAPVVLPQFFAVVTFVAGAILLFSGALPAVRGRLSLLRGLLPLPAIELSHFLGSVTGAGLLLLARGLQRRLDAAYHLTLTLLGAGILFSLLKGLDYEEAIALSVMFLALLPCRRQFYRKASFIARPFTRGWTALIVITLLCAIWLGVFSYKHVDYSHDLWWRFTLRGDAPRFLRAMAGATILMLLYATAELMVPAHPAAIPPGPADMDTVAGIVRNSPKTYANLALLGDKEFLFSLDKRAFIMYGIQGQSWIVMGDPVGPENEYDELIWRYAELCEHYRGNPVFYQVAQEHLCRYAQLGLTFLKLGEEAHVSLPSFSLDGSRRKGLRYPFNKMRRHGCTYAVLQTEQMPAALGSLVRISGAWLSRKHTREKGFSLGYFTPEYIRQFPVAVVHMNEQIVAFANLWVGAEMEELSVDLMRYLPDTPDGIMDYLFVELLLWGQQRGFKSFNLGMAPLAGLEDRALAPLWSKAGALVFRHGEHFYNFQGLRQYKEKFDPQWYPKYLACRGGLALPGTLANVATLVSGGLRGAVAK